jgi:hypothetical protein
MGSPIKGRVKQKNTSPGKKIPFLLGFNIRISTVPFSPLFAPVTSLLLVRGHLILIRTSHPSGSRLSLCLKQCFKHSPWSNQSDPRKSSVPCRVQLDVLQILWFLANPFVAHDIGECQSSLVDLYQPHSWITTAPTLINQKVYSHQTAPDLA